MFYYGESITLELLEKARNRNSFIFIEGEVKLFLEDVEAIDPITFMTDEAFLRLPRWNAKVSPVRLLTFWPRAGKQLQRPRQKLFFSLSTLLGPSLGPFYWSGESWYFAGKKQNYLICEQVYIFFL